MSNIDKHNTGRLKCQTNLIKSDLDRTKNTHCLQRILSCKGALIESTKLKLQWQHRLERTELSKAVHAVELPLKSANRTGEKYTGFEFGKQAIART